MKTIVAFCGLMLTAGTVFGADFQTGDLVVTRVGDGSGALSSAATAVFLDEYNLSGNLVQSLALPPASTPGSGALTLQGSSPSEGFLQRSADGRFLALAGYNVAPGTTSASGSANARTVALINLSGAIDTSTIITSGLTSGGSIRSVWTDNGSRFWASTTSAGVSFIDAVGAASSTQLSTAPANTRVVLGLSGQLYVSSASTGFQGVSTVGLGLPTSSGQTTTLLNGFPAGTSPSSYDFFLADQNPLVAGLDTAWVADDRALNNGGGVQHWNFDGSVWSLSYTLKPSAGARGLAVDLSGPNPIIFVTTGGTLEELIDSGDPSASATTLALAPANTAFRGVEFTPVPEPSALAMIGLGFLLFLARARR